MFNLVDCQVFVPSPGAGVGVMGASFDADRDGRKLVSLHWLISRSDTADIGHLRRSADAGRTWGPAKTWPTRFDDPRGTGRRHYRGGYVDPATNRYITLWTQGVLPNDEPLEGMMHWTLHYSVSDDAGETERFSGQIIHQGPGYDAVHHLPDVTVGCNAVMMGDLGQCPLTRSDGIILVPVQSSPIGPNGKYHNPGSGFTYTDCMVLMGQWRSDGQLAWTCSRRIVGNPARTTRGLIEPTIAQLADGRILMIMRGSNDRRPVIPGYKWQAVSQDGGQTWSAPAPWTFDDGAPFHSPSACSQLLAHSSGRLLWIGNICPGNPQGNGPRYPIVVGEVDQATGRLKRGSVWTIDDRRDGESHRLTLSNFYVREERATGDLLLHLPRFFPQQAEGQPADFTSHLWQYRISVHV